MFNTDSDTIKIVKELEQLDRRMLRSLHESIDLDFNKPFRIVKGTGKFTYIDEMESIRVRCNNCLNKLVLQLTDNIKLKDDTEVKNVSTISNYIKGITEICDSTISEDSTFYSWYTIDQIKHNVKHHTNKLVTLENEINCRYKFSTRTCASIR